MKLAIAVALCLLGTPSSARAAEVDSRSAMAVAGTAHADKAQSQSLLRGAAAVHSSRPTKNYAAGEQALTHRQYQLAEKRLRAAIEEAGAYNPTLTLKARLALADVFLATGDYPRATTLLSRALTPVRKQFGSRSLEAARTLHGLAQLSLAEGKYTRAAQLCAEALDIRKKSLGPASHEVAQSLRLLATIKAKEGWNDEAEPLYKSALAILEKESGAQNLDLADLLQDMGRFYQRQLKSAEAKPYFDRSLAIRESAARFDQPAVLKGLVSIPWDAGAPGSREIPDHHYPLRYQSIDGLRVATTLVHIGRASGAKVYAALISIMNTSDKRAELGIGSVALDAVKPLPRHVTPIEPNKIDRIYWERAVWDLTYKRPALANIQTPRPSIGHLRGELPDVAENYGGNVFDDYGKWGIGPRSIPEIIARERMHAHGDEIDDPHQSIMTPLSALDLSPTPIGPGESRTGIVFFKNEPFEQALVKVRIGNASFEFPFNFVEPW